VLPTRKHTCLLISKLPRTCSRLSPNKLQIQIFRYACPRNVGSTQSTEPQPTTAAPGVAILATPTELALSTPLKELFAHLPAIISSTNHSEIWGVKLTDPFTSIPTQIILQKYLNANDQDVNRAKDQLTKSLAWRAKMKPLELTKAKYSKEKFGRLGYVTVYDGDAEESTEPEAKEIFTWCAPHSRSIRSILSGPHPDHATPSGTSTAMSHPSTAPSAWWMTSLSGVSR
jgi:hypothetical protein